MENGSAQCSAINRYLKVPFLKELDRGELSIGCPIGVKGVLPAAGSSFAFNLCTGKSVAVFTSHIEDKIALQLFYKAGHGLRLLSFLHNRWGDSTHFPEVKLRPGKEFYFRIAPKENCYEISLDGEYVGEYKYVIPVDAVKVLFAQGDVQLQRVEFEGDYYMVPMKAAFDKFVEGTKLHINGKPYPNAESFSIDLCDNGDVPLHLEARFGQQAVYRNTCKRGEWKRDEVHGSFPFKADTPFDIVVSVHDEFLEVYVDGRRFARFSHFPDPTLKMVLHITGDVTIHHVHLDRT